MCHYLSALHLKLKSLMIKAGNDDPFDPALYGFSKNLFSGGRESEILLFLASILS